MSFHIHSRHSMVIPLKNVAEWYFSTFLGMMGMGLEWWFQSFEAHSHHSHHSYHSKFQGHSGFHSFHFGLIPSFGAHSNSFEKQKTMAICRNEKGMRDWSRMVSQYGLFGSGVQGEENCLWRSQEVPEGSRHDWVKICNRLWHFFLVDTFSL